MADKEKGGSMTGLSDEEAKHFNTWLIRGFMVFVAFAIAAHLLVYMWQPWFANSPGNFG